MTIPLAPGVPVSSRHFLNVLVCGFKYIYLFGIIGGGVVVGVVVGNTITEATYLEFIWIILDYFSYFLFDFFSYF